MGLGVLGATSGFADNAREEAGKRPERRGLTLAAAKPHVNGINRTDSHCKLRVGGERADSIGVCDSLEVSAAACSSAMGRGSTPSAEPTARYRILERLDCGVGGTADRHPQRESTRRLAQSTTVVRQTNLRRIEFRSCQSPRPDSAARSSARAANTERPDAPVAPARPRLLIERPNAHRVYQRRDVLSADLEALAPDEIRSIGFLANEARGAARRIIA